MLLPLQDTEPLIGRKHNKILSPCQWMQNAINKAKEDTIFTKLIFHQRRLPGGFEHIPPELAIAHNFFTLFYGSRNR